LNSYKGKRKTSLFTRASLQPIATGLPGPSPASQAHGQAFGQPSPAGTASTRTTRGRGQSGTMVSSPPAKRRRKPRAYRGETIVGRWSTRNYTRTQKRRLGRGCSSGEALLRWRAWQRGGGTGEGPKEWSRWLEKWSGRSSLRGRRGGGRTREGCRQRGAHEGRQRRQNPVARLREPALRADSWCRRGAVMRRSLWSGQTTQRQRAKRRPVSSRAARSVIERWKSEAECAAASSVMSGTGIGVGNPRGAAMTDVHRR
jgi:hypothetical protein